MHADGASLAVRRFGLGPRPGELARAAADPRGYVLAQLDPARARLEQPGLASTAAILAAVQDFRFEVAVARQMAAEGSSSTPPTTAAGPQTGPSPERRPGPLEDAKGAVKPDAAAPSGGSPPPTAGDDLRAPRAYLAADMIARVERMLTTETALVERLVAFWSNHFAIAGAFEPPHSHICVVVVGVWEWGGSTRVALWLGGAGRDACLMALSQHHAGARDGRRETGSPW